LLAVAFESDSGEAVDKALGLLELVCTKSVQDEREAAVRQFAGFAKLTFSAQLRRWPCTAKRLIDSSPETERRRPAAAQLARSSPVSCLLVSCAGAISPTGGPCVRTGNVQSRLVSAGVHKQLLAALQQHGAAVADSTSALIFALRASGETIAWRVRRHAHSRCECAGPLISALADGGAAERIAPALRAHVKDCATVAQLLQTLALLAQHGATLPQARWGR
jgi:hypothetical protein